MKVSGNSTAVLKVPARSIYSELQEEKQYDIHNSVFIFVESFLSTHRAGSPCILLS